MTTDIIHTNCPFCGGTVIRAGIINSTGKHESSLCCGLPVTLIDGYETFASLPAELQQATLQAIQATEAAREARLRREAQEYARAIQRWAPVLDAIATGDTITGLYPPLGGKQESAYQLVIDEAVHAK